MRMAQRAAIVAVVLAASGFAAGAQTVPGAAAPVSADPAATTATYGDWVLRCQTPAAPADPSRRLCEVVQTMQMQGQQQPVAQVAFGKAQTVGDLHLVVALPVNVAFPSSVVVATGDKDAHPLTLDWKRCIPGACFADLTIGAEAVARWRTASTPGRLTFKQSSAQDIALPMSFRGLGQALDALNKSS